ncbi:MAG: LmbE family protein [Bacteroidetes bacterium MedPE-SWsnd-G1]|nr:MAG: LmbE family protein [Bacteroidetes bacterium MedPE-SWsnd-G1]
MNRILLTLFLCIPFFLSAQQPPKPSSSEIYEDIRKLNFLGTALYIAAHPDDENTTLISYLANDVKARTGYLSLTRGDGGQNLIGPEIREFLGVIRTQELLRARKTDGGEQLFTRANDFGYSRHPDETLEIWNKEEVLGDVVLAIRKFRPDVIINRFSHKPESFGNTHGHHTSSAVLSELAFDLAGDESQYTEQLEKVKVWQPRREFFNTSTWFYGGQEAFDKADKSNMVVLDVGTFYPSNGLSNTEISSLSRSMHKSQGFGSTGSRGARKEYLELVKGDMPIDIDNVFDGIDTSWNRVEGGEAIGNILKEVEDNFEFRNPSKSISKLIEAYRLILDLKDDYWRVQKTKEIKKIIQACAGLFLEITSSEPYATRGSEVDFKIEAINRSEAKITLGTVNILPLYVTNYDGAKLDQNKRVNMKLEGVLLNDMEYTSPYWLQEPGTLGMYKVVNEELIGLPETPRTLKANFSVKIEGFTFDFLKEVVYKYNDPVKGEVYRPFEVIPEISASLSEKVVIFPDEHEKEINVIVRANEPGVKGKIELNIPEGWSVSPQYYALDIATKGAEQSVTFQITPSKEQSNGFISPLISYKGEKFSNELVEIDYDHIPFQSVLMPSKSKVVRLSIEKKGQLIGYIQGAGDDIPASLRQVGYTVVELNENEIKVDKLKDFDAIVLGVRTYNTSDDAKFYQEILHEYVNNGGTMLVQYNTSHRLKVDKVAPLPITLSRGRVTNENSKVQILAPEHEVMQYPNEISEKDFDDWVQERGLYFPKEWSADYTAILGMNDLGKPQEKGSLLVAKYGDGYFIYTGLSFFRELPAGVSGAFRLYTNLLSIGKNETELNKNN